MREVSDAHTDSERGTPIHPVFDEASPPPSDLASDDVTLKLHFVWDPLADGIAAGAVSKEEAAGEKSAEPEAAAASLASFSFCCRCFSSNSAAIRLYVVGEGTRS